LPSSPNVVLCPRRDQNTQQTPFANEHVCSVGQNRHGHRGYGVKDIAKLLLASAHSFFAIAKRHFGSLAFDELTDLAADGSQHIEQLLIGLPDLAAEKLDHA
jgi:hypothetical protein